MEGFALRKKYVLCSYEDVIKAYQGGIESDESA